MKFGLPSDENHDIRGKTGPGSCADEKKGPSRGLVEIEGVDAPLKLDYARA
jgi:hypothetical protein